MALDDIKTFTLFLLHQYQIAWRENATLRAMSASVPMNDGTRGIPLWEQILIEYLSDERALITVADRFTPLYSRIKKLQQESGFAELLRKVPPMGGIQ